MVRMKYSNEYQYTMVCNFLKSRRWDKLVSVLFVCWSDNLLKKSTLLYGCTAFILMISHNNYPFERHLYCINLYFEVFHLKETTVIYNRKMSISSNLQGITFMLNVTINFQTLFPSGPCNIDWRSCTTRICEMCSYIWHQI